MKNKPSKSSSWLVSCLLLGTVSALSGQSLEGDFRKEGIHVRASFANLTEIFQTSSAVLYDDWQPSEYGVIVSEDGQILVKASELEAMAKGKTSVMIGKKKYRSFEVLASDPAWDLILIKVEAQDLLPVVWSDHVPDRGTIVLSNSATSRFQRRAQMGVISATARPVGSDGLAVLGVAMGGADEEVIRVSAVVPESGADKAGLQEEDLIESLDGVPVAAAEDIIEALKKKAPGETVTLSIKRGEEALEIEVELGERQNIFEEQLTRNDGMSGEFSKRRTNFPMVLQHDTSLAERTTGGPLLTLDGKCVGMNIAFASREASYAIPAAELQQVLAELRTMAGL